MLDLRWLQHAPLVGVIIVILVSGFIALQDEKGRPTQHDQKAQTGQTTFGPNAAAVDTNRPQSSGTANTQQPCDSSSDCSQKDLIAQQQMADATNRIADIAEQKSNAAGVEFYFLLLTVGVATIAVAVALNANRIARKSNERQLRAYVGTKDARITMNDDGELSYRVRYMNYGQTPALNLDIKTSCTATPLPLEVSLISETEPDQLRSMGILWPHQLVHNEETMLAPGTQSPGRFTPQYRDDIAASRAGIFLHGEITYVDIFKKRRTTTFRLIYTGPWGGNQPLKFSNEGNKAD